MVYEYLTTVLSRSPVLPSALFQPGAVLRGKYRVERVLGAGGMGTVLLATHLRLSQPVAIKVLRFETAGRKDVLVRFAREARAASKLRGEHAVRILDVDDSDGGDPFLVMEFLEGVDLHQHLAASGQLSVEDAVGYVLQACEGIAEAHAAGIVHRDLKPANLFLTTRADGSLLVKILDFGISKAMEPEAPLDFQITKPSTAIGSPSYMSPEQLKNSSDVDARTDIWSLGVVLYQLLTNTMPFEATSTAALAACIAADPPTPLRALRSDAPEELEGVVLRCLEKNASSRYSDIADLARALAPFASGGSSGATRVARVAKTRRAVQEKERLSANPPSLSAHASVPSPIVSPGTASLPGLAPSPLQRALETEYGSTVGPGTAPHARKNGRWLVPTVLGLMVVGGLTTLAVTRGRLGTSSPAPNSARQSEVPIISPEPVILPEIVTSAMPTQFADASTSFPTPSVAPRRPKSAPRVVPPSPARSKDNPMDIDFR